jgi:SpoVK/Ycf46/Vps4 family AAA+-type ATPase
MDRIVGLTEVKDYVLSLEQNYIIQRLRESRGMKADVPTMHMIFTGNPGTGKTTIARLISRYMKAIGALSQGQLVEVTRADLVAQYVGQTAPLTMSVIKSAIGGVLFIDEAYSLYRGKDDSFGLECIDTLVKAMEDHRDDLIVILAGYKKEMAVFLESNSGLKSRFPNLIDFPDYTGEELRKIAALQAKGKGYTIDEAVFEKLESYFNEVQSINAAEAGNGRLARNVVEDAILRQSERIVKDPQADMSLLKEEDFDFTIKVKPAEKKDDTTLEDLMKLMNK